MARIVYHGSGRVDPAFTRGGGSEGRSGIGGDYGPGIYFASKKADAAFYGPHVGKYEISVERPLRICKGQPGDAEVRRLQRVFRISGEALEVEVEDGSHPVAGMMAMVKWGYKPQSVQRVLEKLGYDSICVSAAELRKSSPEVSGDFWIVFDPANIRKLNPKGKSMAKSRKKNPRKHLQSFDAKLSEMASEIIRSNCFSKKEHGEFARRIRECRRIRRADFSKVWPQLAVYILSTSEFSVLRSLKEVKYSRKARVAKLVVRLSMLYKTGGSKRDFYSIAEASAAESAATEHAYGSHEDTFESMEVADLVADAAMERAGDVLEGAASIYADAAVSKYKKTHKQVPKTYYRGAYTLACRDYANKLVELMEEVIGPGGLGRKIRRAVFPNPIGKRLDFVRKQYVNRPEVFDLTRNTVARTLKVDPDEIDPYTNKSWEKAIPWLAKNINALLKKRERGADVSHELRVLNRSFEQSVRVITDRPKRKGKRQVELSKLSPKQARKFATRTAKTKLEKEQARAAEAGYKIVKKLGDGYIAVVGTPNLKAPNFPSTRAEQEAWVHENARFQQWVGSSMNNCLGWFGAYDSQYPVSKFEIQRKGGKLYAILDPKGKPVVATLTNAQNKVIETNGPGNRPPPESAYPYIQKLEKAMGWIGGKKAAFHPPPDFDRRIASVIEMLLDSSYFTDNLRERRYFVRKANGYARQAGADFSGVWPAFAIYILVESKYSALASLRKTDYPKKKDIESIIVKVARLYRSGGSREEFDKVYKSARDAAGHADAAVAATARAARSAAAAYAAAHAAAHAAAAHAAAAYAAHAAHAAAAYAAHAANAVAYAARAATNADYAKKLLELMHKAASDAGRNLQQQARRNPVRRKKATKKTTRKKTPTWQLLIARCQKQWEHYCARPSKKRIKEVFEHLETMKASTSEKVRDERSRCLRAANKEAKKLGMK